MKQSNQQRVILTLRVAAFMLFAGRAWQHLFWDAPFRALLWDQKIMEGLVVRITGGTWQEYVTSEKADHFIQWVTTGFGIFYSVMAVLTLFVTSRWRKVTWLYVVSSVSLAFLAFLYSKDKFYHVGQFFEYSIQFLLPLFFIFAVTRKVELSKLNLGMKIAIALTFTSHGLYAFGAYPQPGNFVDMVIHIFHCSESFAKSFLKVAGILDFVISVTIFIPRLARVSLLYAAIWGGLTALARTWANFYIEFPLDSLHQNLFETFYRLPHMLVPLVVLLINYPGFGRIRKTGIK